MFMCSGQEFSHGLSARSSQTPARQRRTRMWSSNSWRKWRSVVSTGFGALWPRPHSEVSRTMRHSSSSDSMSCSVAVPTVKRFSMRRALSRPTRQGTHLPQLSECVNSMK